MSVQERYDSTLKAPYPAGSTIRFSLKDAPREWISGRVVDAVYMPEFKDPWFYEVFCKLGLSHEEIVLVGHRRFDIQGT